MKTIAGKIKTHCPHQLFEIQASTTPEKVALIQDTEFMTYGELNRRANKLANSLKKSGIVAGKRVGVVLDRSFDLFIAVIAVLKTGAAYVPADPELTGKSRLTFMMKDTNASMIISKTKFKDLIDTDCEKLYLDREWGKLERENELNIHVLHSLENLAYISYTSGSTGKPKGIAVPHRSMLGFALDERLQLLNAPVILHYSSISWDVFVLETWPALVSGGTCVLHEERVPTAKSLQKAINLHSIDTLWLTKSLFNLIIEEDQMALEGLSQVMTGGEALSPYHICKAYQKYPDIQIINGYGPSECVVFTTCYKIPQTFNKGADTVPIGTPVGDREIYILNEKKELVDDGDIGELYIGGPAVALGYINQSDLTKKVFIPNMFTNDGSRLYKTGDLVRKSKDGNLEFISRVDHQVKIRGFRIELGEIEAVLNRFDTIAQSVVTILEEDTGNKKLIAYVVPVSNQTVSKPDISLYLEQELPEYMIPAMIVEISEIPLSSTGKVDKNKLPIPEQEVSNSNMYIAPCSEIENKLAAIWRDVLNVQVIGVLDNFFELGGHSLSVTKLCSRILDVFQIELSFKSIFKYPTLENQSRLIESQLNKGVKEILPLKVDLKQDRKPLSFSQQRLWFLDQLNPGNPLYNEAFVYELKGKVDIEVLKSSLMHIVIRHETLRTIFVLDSSEPMQKVVNVDTINIPIVDFSGLSESAKQQQSLAFVKHEAIRNFDLSKGPLFVCHLIKFTDDLHWLMVNVHHIVFDGWSLSVFMNELAKTYDSLLNNKVVDLPALPVQYTDYAIWQQKWMNSPYFNSQIKYWEERLKGANFTLSLPTDNLRPQFQTNRGAIEQFEISEEIVKKLRALSKQEDTTMFMTLMAAFQSLLYRYSSQNDIIVGTPIANRNRIETESLIGFFANSLAIRGQIGERQTFLDFLSHIKESAMGAFDNQDIPFEKIVEIINPERNMTHSPLFQVIFALHNELIEDIQFSGITMKPIEIHTGTAKMDLILSLTEEKGRLVGYFEYTTDLFKSKTILRLISHFQTLLESIIENPNQCIEDLVILPATEDRGIMAKPQMTEGTNILRDFELQAINNPELVALKCNNEELTYRELNKRANCLANYLIKKGATQKSVISIFFEPSIDLIVSMLSVWKIGGQFILLDPKESEDYNYFVFFDSNPDFLITNYDFEDLLPHDQLDSLSMILLDREEDLISRQSEIHISIERSHNNPAFIKYVVDKHDRLSSMLIDHEQLALLFAAVENKFNIKNKDVLTLIHPINSDFFLFEMFCSLRNGAKLVLVPYWMTHSYDEYIDLLKAEKVTVLHSTLFELKNFDKIPSTLRLIITGGEMLKQDIHNWVNQFTSFTPELYYTYGTKETIGPMTAFPLNIANLEQDEGINMIGESLEDLQIMVLDRSLRPMPYGVYGDMYIAGQRVNNAHDNLKAENSNFILIQDKDKQWMLKTGDCARLLDTGMVELRERKGNQVLYKGFDIDLKQIGRIIEKRAEVKHAEVLIEQNNNEERELVAYLVQNSEFSAEKLQKALAQLPNYMLPKKIMFVDELTLGELGHENKVLRDENEQLDDVHLAIQEKLKNIWCEVLNLTEVNPNSNFFELGGTSMIATKVIGRVQNLFNITIPLRSIFELPSLKSLSQRIAELIQEDSISETVEMVREDRSTDISISVAQHRLWVTEQLNVEAPLYHVPIGLKIRGEIDIAALTYAINSIIQRHETLRTTFYEKNDYVVQNIGQAYSIDLKIDEIKNDQLNERIQEFLKEPFNLEKGPLMRATLMKNEEDENILVFVFHHIIIDGGSIRIFVQELADFYEVIRTSGLIQLSEKKLDYVDYSVWQYKWMKNDNYQSQITYWRKQLQDIPSLKLPLDYSRSKNTSHDGIEYIYCLPQNLTNNIQDHISQHHYTMFVTMLAAFKTVMHYLSGQFDIVVGTAMDGRVHTECQDMMGFFVNTLVLRTKLDIELSFNEMQERVSSVLTDAHANQMVPFDTLVEELQPVRQFGLTPFFQVVFVLNDLTLYSAASQDIKFEFYPIENKLAKYDIHFNVELTEDNIYLNITYKSDLFNKVTIERLIHLYETVLQQVTLQENVSLQSLCEILKKADNDFKKQKYNTILAKKRKSLKDSLLNING